MVEHLVGLQAQTTHSWYVGLWNRIEGVTTEQVSALLESRELVRLALMRSTIHLVTARDAALLRPTLAPMLARSLNGSRHARALADGDVDRKELAAAGALLVAETPSTLRELGTRLGDRWPGVDADALGQGVRADLPLVQVTPRGLWRKSGAARHTTLQAWTSAELAEPMPVEQLVRRYLAAYGPATAKDCQLWSGLTRLAEVFDRMRSELVVLTDADGRDVFDLPEAPRPGSDVEAPVRLLYDFDNVLLAHADRSRLASAGHRSVAVTRNGLPPAAVLIDGFAAGQWRIERTKANARLTATPHERFTAAQAAAIEAEALALLGFTDADADTHDVEVHRHPAKA